MARQTVPQVPPILLPAPIAYQQSGVPSTTSSSTYWLGNLGNLFIVPVTQFLYEYDENNVARRVVRNFTRSQV